MKLSEFFPSLSSVYFLCHNIFFRNKADQDLRRLIMNEHRAQAKAEAEAVNTNQ
jgi:hypothetical protein